MVFAVLSSVAGNHKSTFSLCCLRYNYTRTHIWNNVKPDTKSGPELCISWCDTRPTDILYQHPIFCCKLTGAGSTLNQWESTLTCSQYKSPGRSLAPAAPMQEVLHWKYISKNHFDVLLSSERIFLLPITSIKITLKRKYYNNCVAHKSLR